MAVDDLPGLVANFLWVIGVPWPAIDEDVVRTFATLVREFATAVQTTHDDATRAVSTIAENYQGTSTQVMHSHWSSLSGQHVSEIVSASHALAVALDASAGYIEAQKAVAVGELIAMAAAFGVDQAAAIATAGLAEAALPALEYGARRLVESLEIDLQQYILGQVIGAAAQPLFSVIDQAVAGLDWPAAGGAPDAGTSLSLSPDAVQVATDALRAQAQTMLDHAAQLRSGLLRLDF